MEKKVCQSTLITKILLAGYKQCLQVREIHVRDSYEARDDALGKSAWHQRVCVRDTRLALKVLRVILYRKI